MTDYTSELQHYVPENCKISKVPEKQYYLVNIPEIKNYIVIDIDKDANITFEDDGNLCEALHEHGLIPIDTSMRMDWFNDMNYSATRHDFELESYDDMENNESTFEVKVPVALDDLKQAIQDYIDFYNEETKPVLA